MDGRYLFGAPAASLELEGDVSVCRQRRSRSRQWKGIAFGLTDETVDGVQNTIAGLPQTDAKGHADLSVALPELPTTSRPLEAKFTIRMREPGGRAVERSLTLPISSTKPLLGIKPGFPDEGVRESEPATFEPHRHRPGGGAHRRQGRAVDAEEADDDLPMVRERRQLDVRAGDVGPQGRRAERSTSVVTRPAPLSTPVEWGEYRLELAAEGLQPASKTFSVGYYTASKADTPDMLPVALDRTSVRSGRDRSSQDRCALRRKGQRAGRRRPAALLHPRRRSRRWRHRAGQVGTDWGTGAYVVVTHFRPMDVAAKRMPTRSIGLAWFGIDRDERTLKVALSPVETMKPRQGLAVPVKIEGLAAGDKAYVTVAAVDVGILNLTRYEPPSPDAHYFDQKRLSAELRDLYGQLIDGMQGSAGRIRTGGDGGGEGIQGSPPAQAPLAQFSGIVEVSPDGTAEVSFDIPAFNGTVRLMAVAWTSTKVGHAAKDVIVRDPIVIAGTLPRFLAVGDTSRFRLDFLNAEAPPGDYTLAVTIEGPVAAEAAAVYQTVTIGAVGSRTPVNIPITANGAGVAELVATLAGPGGVSIDQTYRIGVRPANPEVTRRTVQEIAGKSGSISVSADLFSEMVPGNGAALVFGRPARRARRARPPQGARPLSLWLLGAARQPRAAAPLPQRARRQRGRPRHRRQSARRRYRAASPGAPGFLRRLRPVEQLWRGSLALRLCHRLPAAGAREGLRGAG